MAGEVDTYVDDDGAGFVHVRGTPFVCPPGTVPVIVDGVPEACVGTPTGSFRLPPPDWQPPDLIGGLIGGIPDEPPEELPVIEELPPDEPDVAPPQPEEPVDVIVTAPALPPLLPPIGLPPPPRRDTAGLIPFFGGMTVAAPAPAPRPRRRPRRTRPKPSPRRRSPRPRTPRSPVIVPRTVPGIPSALSRLLRLGRAIARRIPLVGLLDPTDTGDDDFGIVAPPGGFHDPRRDDERLPDAGGFVDIGDDPFVVPVTGRRISPRPAPLPSPFVAPPHIPLFDAPGLPYSPTFGPSPLPDAPPRQAPVPRPGVQPSPGPIISPFPVPELVPQPFAPPLAPPATPTPPRPAPVSPPLLGPGLLTLPQPQPIPKTDPCEDCAAQRKPRTKRKPRDVCYRGTYTELSNGLIKRKKEKVPCR